MANFFDRVYQVVARIPRGRVASYGQIAEMLGHPRGARTVGWALHELPQGSRVPWHRVINAAGRISIPEVEEAHEQRIRLEQEGVVFDERGYIDMRRYQWRPPLPRPAEGRRISTPARRASRASR
ncbi:MAG: MGMT family protein [Chloroflexi bacterium]|nr:MGMT family protein [Chloroflexota bacterium]